MDIKKEVALLEDELIKLRRDFHRHPELGFEEFRTSQIVADYLQACGIEVKKVAKTGVVGFLQGTQPGPTVMLRADMDALAQQEQNDLPYKSVIDGKMHACGHDGHTAMLLIAAKILARHKDQLKGNVKFVFQPNEETAGALDMINEGVLENPKVDAAFGIHLWTPIESGKIGLVNGPIMAGNEEFELTIYGKAGHTSAPHNAVDAIIAAANIVNAIQMLQSREMNVLNPTMIMIGKIKGGTARNIIADQVELGGTIRYLYPDEEKNKAILLEKFERIIKANCEMTRTEFKLEYIPSNPSIENHPVMVELVRIAARETLGGEENIISHQVMAGEDFAEFSRRVPSAFYFVGTGNKEKGTDFAHHHPKFNIDEDTLKIGVEMHIRAVLGYLGK